MAGELTLRQNWTYGNNDTPRANGARVPSTTVIEPAPGAGAAGASGGGSGLRGWASSAWAKARDLAGFAPDGVTDIHNVSKLAKTAGVLGVGAGAIEAGQGLREGNYGKAALGAGDALASAGLATGVGAPVAALYGAGRLGVAAGQTLYDHMPQYMQDDIGSLVNKGAQFFGGGIDDKVYAGERTANERGESNITGNKVMMPGPTTTTPPTPAAAPATAPTTAAAPAGPMGPPDPPMLGGKAGMDVPGAGGVSKFVTPDGRTLYTNVPGSADNDKLMSGKPGVQVVPGGGAGLAAGGPSAASGAYAQPGALSAPGIGIMRDESVTGNPNYMAMPKAGSDFFERRDMSPRLRMEMDSRREGHQVQREGQQLQHSAALRGQDLNYGATTRGQDLNYDSAMYGHNIGMRSTAARLNMEYANRMREQSNWERDHAIKQAESNQNMSVKADEATQKHLESLFRKTNEKGESVADHDKIASYTKAADSTIKHMIGELQQVGTPEAMAKAKELSDKGFAGLDKTDHARLKQLFDVRERARQAYGMLPNKGDFVDSDNLLGYRQKGGLQPRVIGGDRYVTDNGTGLSIKDMQLADGPANYLLPDWGRIRTDNLTQGMRR